MKSSSSEKMDKKLSANTSTEKSVKPQLLLTLTFSRTGFGLYQCEGWSFSILHTWHTSHAFEFAHHPHHIARITHEFHHFSHLLKLLE